jgi:hypothetical protein
MNAAFFRCLARVLSMAAGSLIFMLPVDSWASYLTSPEAGFSNLATRGEGSPGSAIITSNRSGSIRNILARPP